VTQRDYIAVVERAQRGDLSAFSELVVRFQDLAVGTAFGWLGEIETARDVSQEAFIEAHVHLLQLREPAAFPAWLRRLVIKHCDRATRRRRVPLAAFDLALDVAAASPEADADVAQDERARWLRLGVEGLPPNERVVVALHYFAEVSGPDLSRFLELPLSTIKQRLRRARARLRDDGDRLMQETLDKLRPSKTHVFAEEVAFFIALRAGDRARVRQMLAESPELVHAQQEWEPGLVYQGVLPFASRATALITAIERDDLPMQTLLLDAGANVDGVCGCVTGESPVWAATVLGRRDHLRELLARGANPNVVAATGNTPLHVAAMRGLRDVAFDLLTHGARPDAVDAHGRTPADWANLNGHADLVKLLAESTPTRKRDQSASIDRERPPMPVSEEILWTGIKALDLFAPVRRGRLVRVPFKAGVGMVVLLGELSKRILLRPNGRALWTGFAQRPFDLRDWEAEMAEFGLTGLIEHRLVSFEQTPQQRRDAFAEGLARAEALRDAGDEVLVVLLCDTGFESDVDASLVRLSGDVGPGRITTLLVTPFPENPEDVWRDLAPPYKAQIVLDRRRARKMLFPSIDPSASLSGSLTDAFVGRRHVGIAERAKQVLDTYARLDPNFDLFGTDHREVGEGVVRAHRLLGYLRQPFLVAEPFSGHPGVSVGQTELLDAVEAILDQ
jgi:RNA polymerase sigma factor (sigma-70 family)